MNKELDLFNYILDNGSLFQILIAIKERNGIIIDDNIINEVKGLLI